MAQTLLSVLVRLATPEKYYGCGPKVSLISSFVPIPCSRRASPTRSINGSNPAAMSVAVTPDGKHAVVGGFHDALAVLDLAELAAADVDPRALCRRAELLAGQRLHEGGGMVNLSADEWLDRWRKSRR